MKKYYFLGILIIIFVSFGIYIWNIFSKDNILKVQVLSNEGLITEKKIQEINNKNKYKIRIYYPYTAYNYLNTVIEEMIQKNISEFKNNIPSSNVSTSTQFYCLEINYDTYKYKNYITYVFYIFTDTGGAHPNTYIKTITFDTNNKQIITINSLSENNKNILNILSKESRKQLKINKKFKKGDYERIQNMILEGTKPTLENFRNFAFSEDGMITFFENYQVAPYVYGSFQTTIPYDKLDLLLEQK